MLEHIESDGSNDADTIKLAESLVNLHKPCICRDLYDRGIVMPGKHTIDDDLFTHCSKCGNSLDTAAHDRTIQRMSSAETKQKQKVLCAGCLGAVWQNVHMASLE